MGGWVEAECVVHACSIAQSLLVGHATFDQGFRLNCLLALVNAVLAEVEWLLLNCIVLSNVPILCRAKEWLDALRVVAEGENEVLIVSAG